MRRVVAASVLLALIVAVPLARGQGAALGTDLVPWPQALSPSQVPNDVQAHPVENCRRAAFAASPASSDGWRLSGSASTPPATTAR